MPGALEKAPEIWREYWGASQATYPGAYLYFLTDDFVIKANDILGLPNEAIGAFSEALLIIRGDSELSRLAWHWHYLLFNLPELQLTDLDHWPLPETSMGKYVAMFPAITLLSGLPKALRLHKDKGIPKSITRDTFTDMDIWMRDYHEKHGLWGLNQTSWLRNHFTGKIYRLGRLQFMPKIFKDNIKVFFNSITSEVIVLSEPGVRFRSDSQVDGTNAIFDPKGSWTSELSENDHIIEGNMISRKGYVW